MNKTDVINAYDNGMPLWMVAKQFGISMHKVLDIMYKHMTKVK